MKRQLRPYTKAGRGNDNRTSNYPSNSSYACSIKGGRNRPDGAGRLGTTHDLELDETALIASKVNSTCTNVPTSSKVSAGVDDETSTEDRSLAQKHRILKKVDLEQDYSVDEDLGKREFGGACNP